MREQRRANVSTVSSAVAAAALFFGGLACAGLGLLTAKLGLPFMAVAILASGVVAFFPLRKR
jgi:hypothetical protein